MAWIILEGLDRSGKSSVAEYYKSQGYHYVHMNAPDKKYSSDGYAGPGYIDEMVELYTSCDGRDVVFDRSIYGEKVWPAVFGRTSQLSYEDFEVLEDFERQNETQYILMWDPNFDEHWARCVKDREPLKRHQFNHAVAMYERLENYGFIKKNLSEFAEVQEFLNRRKSENTDKSSPTSEKSIRDAKKNTPSTGECSITSEQVLSGMATQQIKLEKANAINSLLNSRIIKKRGPIFDPLEKDLRDFLNNKLDDIFGNSKEDDFTEQEIQVLKLYAARILEKHKEK